MNSAARSKGMSSLRIVFCGTPQFAVPTLKRLLAIPAFQLLAVITQPDRPRGRGQQVSISPVKEVALAAHLPVHQPEKIRAPEVQQILEEFAPDVIVIIAYGQIIPGRLLAVPKHGWINLHASLLPKYRGAAPINWAIANGETRTGLTTMRINVGMDSGDILLQHQMEIGPAETASELTARMSEAGAPLVEETLRGLAAGKIIARPQDHTQATLAPMLKKEDGRIDWTRAAQEIYNRMRAFAPWPGAYTTFRSQACHLWGEPLAQPASLPAEVQGNPSFTDALAAPGSLVGAKSQWFVSCGRATFLRLHSVKLGGRKQVSIAEFINGARLQSGERFVGA
jgi:methionyl-tRNA formyltransferase